MPFRPSRWAIYSPVAVLPFLASLILQGKSLEADIAGRVSAALVSADAGWAKAGIYGRDVSLSGDAPSAERMDAAIAAAAGTHGVRRLESSVRVVEPPPASPTVKPVSGLARGLTVAGTWPEQQGNSLTVSIGGKTFALGKDAALTSDGIGNWSLALSEPLKPGTYDVTASVTGGSGLVSSDAGKDEVTISEPPELKAPTVASLESRDPAPVVTGTWDPAVANALSVTVGTVTFRLGADAALTTAGREWKLILPAPLADGVHEVTAEVGDDFGRVAKSVAPGKLMIDSTPPAEPAIFPVAKQLPLKISGSMPPDAESLVARLAGRTWMLGRDTALQADGKGNWTLAPDIALAPGTYDLAIEIADRLGNAARDSTVDEIVVAVPPELKAPAVNPLIANSATPELTGTWPSALARELKVMIGDAPYTLGNSPALTASGDDWTLKIPAPLADGAYAVTAEVSDELGRTARTAAPAEMIVDTLAPAVPAITPFNGELPLTVNGKWAEGDAVSLAVSLAGKSWTLAKDHGLASDGKGNWSFTPDISLQPGTYDLGVEIIDRAGNVSRDSTRDEIVIAAPPLPPRMEAPTVSAAEETAARPVVKGTWPEMAAESLGVTVAGRKYVLGENPELASDGIGNWALSVPGPLADGVYDVAVTSTDAAGKALSDSTRNELTIDARGPAAPAVTPIAGEASPERIGGTWDWRNAVSLRVAIPSARVDAMLGGNPALTAVEDRWILELAAPLSPGSYDVVAESADARGRVARDQTRFEILVKEPPPPPQMKAPSVTATSADEPPAAVTGTWDEGVAKDLFVAITGTDIRAALGSDPALTSDGKGNWNLALAQRLAPGIYDVAVESVDAAGNSISDSSTAEIYVKAPLPPPPEPMPALPPMKAPTVTSFSGEQSPAALTGTWDEGVARDLFVSVGDTGIRAALGSDTALTSDGKGNWSFALAQRLAPGIYDVAVETVDAAGNRVADSSTAEIYVKAEPPTPASPPVPPPLPMKAPTVEAVQVEGAPPAIVGTWDEGAARDLFVTITGTDIRAALGSDAALTSDGQGNWRLVLSEKLAEGVYDVAVETADAAGNRISDATVGEIKVLAPLPLPETPVPPQLDCDAALQAIVSEGHIRFAFNRRSLGPEARQTVDAVAKLLADEQCRGFRLDIVGHADDLGMKRYNEWLSMWRAETVAAALVANGIDAVRLTARGVGETSPEIDERTRDARAVNRRVVLTLIE